jgi:6-phosphogluconolactonase
MRRFCLSAICFFVCAAALLHAAPSPECLVYVGTYTDRGLVLPARENAPGARSQGIYVFRLDLDSGQLTSLGLAAETPNPTYVAVAASGKFLYAVNEVSKFQDEPNGSITAFAIDPRDGHLRSLNQVSARGAGPCHACLDHTGKNLLAANFGSGSIAVFPIAADGSLRPASAFAQDHGSGPNPRQATPHAHSINVSPDNRLAIAAEFGTDRLLVYRFDASAGTITPADPAQVTMKPGSAPRHFTFHPDGKTAYSLNEIDSTVTVLRYDATTSRFQPLQNLSALPDGFRGQNTAAEVLAHPSGKFLYTSNRGHNSIAVFAIDPDGKLRLVTHVASGGKTPRGFGVDPTGRWLIAANQSTHNLAVFAIDPTTGIPRATGVTANVHTPVCVKFLPL